MCTAPLLVVSECPRVGNALLALSEPRARPRPCLSRPVPCFSSPLGQRDDYSDGDAVMDAWVISPMDEGSGRWGGWPHWFRGRYGGAVVRG